jgi:ferredoxin
VVAKEFYTLDDNGYNAERGKTLNVPPALAAAARLGASKCPERAITIIEE